MMRGRNLLAVAVLFFLVACGQAMAWNSVGHMSVAYAAYQQLTPAEKARAAALLKLNPLYAEWLGYIPPAPPTPTAICTSS